MTSYSSVFAPHITAMLELKNSLGLYTGGLTLVMQSFDRFCLAKHPETTALTREAGYVALSRGRTSNHLYVADNGDERDQGLHQGHLDELAARLSQRRTQTLATRQLPRTQPGRWQTSRTAQPDQPRIEGISR